MGWHYGCCLLAAIAPVWICVILRSILPSYPRHSELLLQSVGEKKKKKKEKSEFMIKYRPIISCFQSYYISYSLQRRIQEFSIGGGGVHKHFLRRKVTAPGRAHTQSGALTLQKSGRALSLQKLGAAAAPGAPSFLKSASALDTVRHNIAPISEPSLVCIIMKGGIKYFVMKFVCLTGLSMWKHTGHSARTRPRHVVQARF